MGYGNWLIGWAPVISILWIAYVLIGDTWMRRRQRKARERRRGGA